ncbi:MAG: DUF3842 family protein [Candidatus Latescibacteria bacterium]|nr:DUF3842 family protein [Candidatus Latescibacterota bacterium]
MKIGVVDGQGGGIGSQIVKKLRGVLPAEVEIFALGTNGVATANMMKAGATKGASGENAIILNIEQMDLVTGPIGIVLANSMLGELTARVAEAVAGCRAHKVLLPVEKCGVEIAGVDHKRSLPRLIDEVVKRIEEMIGEKETVKPKGGEDAKEILLSDGCPPR